jgi:hypothetical protein
MEVAALETLHQLDLRPEQLKSLADLARGAAEKSAARRTAKVTPAYRQALAGLHAALAAGDDDRIDQSREKLETVIEKDKPEIDDQIPVTDAAWSRAHQAFQILTVSQVGALLAAQELADPLEVLTEGLELVRGLESAEKDEVRDQTAAEVAWLVGGHDGEAAHPVRAQAVELLDRAHRMKEAEFKRELPNLKTAAGQILNSVDTLQVLGHIAEHRLAELLSNPRLEPAIRALGKR